MNCATCRTQLGPCFDEGRDPPPELVDHLRSCSSCQAYRARLEALDAALAEVPLEETRPALASEIRARIARGQGSHRRTSAWGWALGACAVVGMCVGGWFWPLPEVPLGEYAAAWQVEFELPSAGEWLARSAAAWQDADLAGMGEWFLSQLAGAYREIADWNLRSIDFTSSIPLKLPPVLAWTSFAGVLAVLLTFNAIQARMLRTGISIDSGAPRTKGDDSC